MATQALATMLANGPDPSVTVNSVVAANGLGNCTCAAPCHAIDVWTAGGDAPVVVTADQCIRLYELSCGYVLGDESTDQGGDELTVLDYILAHGIDGAGLHQIAGVASLDATDLTLMREACFLTGAVELCLELPDVYVNPFPGPDAVWDVAGAPNPDQGHCILARGAFTTNGPTGKPSWGITTWGTPVWMTTDAVAYYCAMAQGGSANVAWTKEWLSRTSGLSPSALDLAAMAADFAGLS
jgi:hypothetical protein